MRSLSGFGRLALCAMVCSLLFTAAVTTPGLGDSPVVDPAAVLTGWSDQIGNTVTNVGVLDFTAATRIGSGWFRPPNPAWLAGAVQFDGAWTPAGWQVVAATSSDRGTLLMALNRQDLTNRLWLGVSVVASSDAELYVDLLDTNALPVVVNLLGNLLVSGASSTNVLTSIPLSDYPAATVIALRRGKGTITVPLALLAVDARSSAAGGVSTATDKVTAAPAIQSVPEPAAGTTDAPIRGTLVLAGIPNGSSQSNAAPAQAAAIWYVSATGGKDTYSGRTQAWNGQHGPFASILKAMAIAVPGDMISIAGGKYPEAFTTMASREP